MRVPESLVMSGDSARRSPVGEVLERGAASVPEWMDGEKIRVATMLMFEQCKQVCHPYLSLPEKCMTRVVCCDVESWDCVGLGVQGFRAS